MSQLRRVKEQKNKIAFPKSGAASLGGGAAAAVDMYTSLPAPNPPVPKVNRIKFHFFVLVGTIVVALLCVFIFVKAQELRKCKAKQASALKCGPTTQLNTLGTECVPRSDLKRCDNATTTLNEDGVCVSKLDPLPSSKIDDSQSIDAPIIVVLVVLILIAIVFFAFMANRSTTDAASPSPTPSASPGGGGYGESDMTGEYAAMYDELDLSGGGGGDGASPSPPPPPGEEGGGGEGLTRWLETPRQSSFPSGYDMSALALGGMAGTIYGKAHRVVRTTLDLNSPRFREMETDVPKGAEPTLWPLNKRSSSDLSKTPGMDRFIRPLTAPTAPTAPTALNFGLRQGGGGPSSSFDPDRLQRVLNLQLHPEQAPESGIVNFGRLGPPPPVVSNSSYFPPYFPQALISGETAPGRALLQASGPPVSLPPEPSLPPNNYKDPSGQWQEMEGGKWNRPPRETITTGPGQDEFSPVSNATSKLLPALASFAYSSR